MTIRKANLRDLNVLTSMWKDFIDFHADIDSFFRVNLSAPAMYKTYLKKKILARKARVFISEENGRITGWVMCNIQKNPPIFRIIEYGYIEQLCVIGEKRRKGTGALLLEEAYKWFREKGIKRIELDYLPGNPIGSGFWKKKGFKVFKNRAYLSLK